METSRPATPELFVGHDELRRWSTDVLVAAGAPSPSAGRVAESLVESDLRGYGSHGVLRIPSYVAAIREGTLDPGALPMVQTGGHRGTFVVDGSYGFGQLTAALAVDELAERARDTGIAFALTQRCRHVGRLGEYVEGLAAKGFIAFATVSAEPLVAASAGGTRVLGTNPHAWGIPAGEGEPIVVVDFATSVVSAGRVFAAQAQGKRLPEGQLVDRHGNPSRNPDDLLDAGALMPFGAHKGFALGLVADILAGILSGSGSGSSPSGTDAHGLAMLAIDISAFAQLATFGSEVEALRHRVAQSTAGSGTVTMLPGEGSAARRTAGLLQGVTLAPSTVANLHTLGRSLGVADLDHAGASGDPRSGRGVR